MKILLKYYSGDVFCAVVKTLFGVLHLISGFLVQTLDSSSSDSSFLPVYTLGGKYWLKCLSSAITVGVPY